MEPFKIKPDEVRDKIKSIKKGKIFSIKFIKKDGSVRTLSTMNGTTKGVTGRGMAYEPAERGLLPMYDLIQARKTKDPKQSWRMVNVNTVKQIIVDGTCIVIE